MAAHCPITRAEGEGAGVPADFSVLMPFNGNRWSTETLNWLLNALHSSQSCWELKHMGQYLSIRRLQKYGEILLCETCIVHACACACACCLPKVWQCYSIISLFLLYGQSAFFIAFYLHVNVLPFYRSGRFSVESSHRELCKINMTD